MPRKFCGTRPCNECPWRRDVPVGRFSPERFRALRSTVGQGFNPLFACHKTEEGSDNTCVGYLLVDGMQNFAARLAHAQGLFKWRDLKSDAPLYESHKEMERVNSGPGPGPCGYCGKPATCFGQYEDPGDPPGRSCDDCCGHCNEDGWCFPINEDEWCFLTEESVG